MPSDTDHMLATYMTWHDMTSSRHAWCEKTNSDKVVAGVYWLPQYPSTAAKLVAECSTILLDSTCAEDAVSMAGGGSMGVTTGGSGLTTMRCGDGQHAGNPHRLTSQHTHAMH